MQLELSVQDCVDESSRTEVSITDTTWETWFHRWLELLAAEIPKAPMYEMTLRLTDDAEIQQLNAQYRQQDKPTDVLAFAALEVDCPLPPHMPLYLGDIVISVDTAKRQAKQQEHSLQIELAWLASHGYLHLLGWDHPDNNSLMRMLNQQVILLQEVGIFIDIKSHFLVKDPTLKGGE